MISTRTLAIRIGMFPRWMAFLGYALALLLLLSVGNLYQGTLAQDEVTPAVDLKLLTNK